MKLSTLKRVLRTFENGTDVTLNCGDSDDEIRACDRYPFGPKSTMTFIEQEQLKEDFISFRKLVSEVESQKTAFVQICIQKNDPDASMKEKT